MATETMRKANAMDRPNGNLKVGDVFRVTAWCGKMETYRHGGMSMFFAFAPSDEPVGEDENGNKVYKREVNGDLYKVLAVDYPTCVVRHYMIGHATTSQLDMRCFESCPVDPKFAKAFIASSEPKPVRGCLWCSFKAWIRREPSDT